MVAVARTWRSPCTSILRPGSHPVEMRPQPFLDGLRGLDPSPIVELIGIVAFVEELLAAVAFIANVDVIALGD